MKTSFAAGLAAIALAIAAPAAAGVKYTFTALSSYGGGPTGNFVYTAPDFIDSTSSIPAANLDSCASSVGSCTSAFFSAGYIGSYDQIGFNYMAGGGGQNSIYYYFSLNSFTTLGLHDTVLFGADQAATLLVEDTDAQVPEPAMLGLFGLGALGLALSRRRRA